MYRMKQMAMALAMSGSVNVHTMDKKVSRNEINKCINK